MKSKVDAALIAALFSLALALRLVPLLSSPLPYTVDGFALTKIAQGFGATGRWVINPSDPNIDDLKLPGFSLLWFVQVALGGLNPLTDIQWFLPIITSTVVLPMYLLAAKATGRRLVGFAADLFLAVFGSFLAITSSVVKESLGLVLLPTIVLTFYERADVRKRAISSVLLLVLIFIHHLTSLMAAGMIGSLIVLSHTRALSVGRFSGRTIALDVATGLGPFVIAMDYYLTVNLGTVPTALDAYVLFLALIVFLTALVARAWRPAPAQPGRRRLLPSGRVLLVPALSVAGAVFDARTGLFAGTLKTQAAFLELLPAFVLLAAFAGLGYRVVRRTSNRANDLILSMAVAPIALALFGFLIGLDYFSQEVVYRSFDFFDYTFALLAGLGVVFIVARLRNRRVLGVAVAAVYLGALVATTPIARDTQRVFGVDNVTTPGEFQALSVLADLGAKHIASDQRIATAGRWWFGFDIDRSLPYALSQGNGVSGDDYAIVLERWTTIGAQEYPGPNVILSSADVEQFLGAHRVLYMAGIPGDRIFVVQLGGSPTA